VATTTEQPAWDAAVLRRRRGLPPPSAWPAHWPITVLFAGFPLWWALGLASLLPLALALPMAASLLRRRPLYVPRGFGWWLIFMVCVVLSVAMNFVDAPGAVPGGGPSRLIVFAFRLAWYTACTIVLVWVANLDEDELPTRVVVRLMAWMFVVTVAGGLLGVFVPNFEFTAPIELLLPGGLRSNEFVKSLVHPAAAAVQTVLGDPSPRPIAPFAFANSWGANLSMFLPFFLIGWLARDAGWRRLAAPAVLAAAAIPIVLSLNRGLWMSLALGVAFYILRLVLSGKLKAIIGAVVVVVLGGMLVLVSPLGDMVSNRLENPHSNDRRGELLVDTVVSTVEGSPVLGFGGTRDVQGSFASIAGGSPDCPACSVPPLGTQGQIWLVIFSQGLVGTFAFCAFYASQFLQHWRSRTPVQAVGVCLLLFFGLQLFVYDTLGHPMYTMMIAIGLMWRERSSRHAQPMGRSLEEMWAQLRRYVRLIAVLAVLGAVVGGVAAYRWEPQYRATAPVLLAPSPLYLDADSGQRPREITIDTEASMVFAEDAITRVREVVGLPATAPVRDWIQVTAPTSTRVLEITVRSDRPRLAERVADAAAAAYLEVRSEYLAQRREQAQSRLELQLAVVAGTDVQVERPTDEDGGTYTVLAEDELRQALRELSLTSTEPGNQLRAAVAKPVRKQVEVPIVSGALIGILLALLVMSWREAGRALGRTQPRQPGRRALSRQARAARRSARSEP
jgi:hypothetical protein